MLVGREKSSFFSRFAILRCKGSHFYSISCTQTEINHKNPENELIWTSLTLGFRLFPLPLQPV